MIKLNSITWTKSDLHSPVMYNTRINIYYNIYNFLEYFSFPYKSYSFYKL